MADAVYVSHQSGERWVVSTDEDAAPLISEHDNRGDAEGAARAHAITFGITRVIVRGEDGKETTQVLDDVDPQPPTGAGGPAYGPPV